jgi:hypothetical protein
MESHQVSQVIVLDEKERLAGIIFLTLSHRICRSLCIRLFPKA